MKFSESWLREWVDAPVSTQELADQLTMAGLEVEGVEPVAGDFSGVVVAEIRDAQQHPNADKLSLCQVFDGEETHSVICGAPNVRAGMLVAFARIGAVLPGNFKIKKAKLRGVESHGMLCSGAELELSDDSDGILDLPAKLTPGDDLREALKLEDTTIEVDLTPNRGDCLSVRGVAREVGVLYDLPVNSPNCDPVAPEIADTFPVHLESPEGCPKYLGRIIRGINVSAATPHWMTEKLRRSGIRSIDPIVDITNYVVLELGQPMHAFDLANLHEAITVRFPAKGESLTLLDGRNIELDPATLLIADAKGPVAMAGVMGGVNSGISTSTKDVFLEVAFFSQLTIAGTGRRYGLQTDASQRYERGVDFKLQESAMERATRLILDIVGGSPGPVNESVSSEHLPVEQFVSLNKRRLDSLLGLSLDESRVEAIFARLDFAISDQASTGSEKIWSITAPSHRFDIALEADLIEEVCRIFGYDNVGHDLPQTGLELGAVNLLRRSERRLKETAADLGYQEAVTYSFIDPKLQDLFAPGQPVMTVENPMSSEQSVMRRSLLPGLAATLQSNVARQQNQVQLFEMGLCFTPADTLIQELRLAGVRWGLRHAEGWNQGKDLVDFFDIKADVEALLGKVETSFRLGDPGTTEAFHPGQVAEIFVSGHSVGVVGRLHPEIEETLSFETPVFLFELDGEALLTKSNPEHVPVSKFPSVRRDFALLVNKGVQASQIESCVRNKLGETLVEFTLFDVYQGEGIDSTEKSIAVGLTFQDPSATLSDVEIGRYSQMALDALGEGVGAKQR